MTDAVERKEAFLAGLVGILETNPGEINPGLALNEQNWDSTAIVSVIALIDEHFGITVPGEALQTCTSVGELLRLIYASEERLNSDPGL